MPEKKYRLKPLIITVILGLFTPCACAFVVDVFEGDILTRLLSNIFILELILVATVGILPDVVNNIIILKYPNSVLAAPSVFIGLVAKIAHPLAVILLLLYIAINQPAGLNAIGIPQGTSGGILLLFGSFIAYGAFIFLYTLGYKLITRNKTPDKNASTTTPAFKMFSPYKTPWQRVAFSLVLLVVVIAEELLFRGYLVLLWGERSNAILLWALISIILFVGIHLYQGRSTIIFHTLFATVLTFITILTGNIIIAIGMHGLHNLTILLGTWAAIDRETTPQSPQNEVVEDLENDHRNEN